MELRDTNLTRLLYPGRYLVIFSLYYACFFKELYQFSFTVLTGSTFS